MQKKFKNLISENAQDVVEIFSALLKLPSSMLEIYPALNIMFKTMQFVRSQVMLKRFATFIKIINFELEKDIIKFLKKIHNEDVVEFLHDSAKRSIEEKSELLRIAIAIHTASVIKRNCVRLQDVKIYRSLKDLSDKEIYAFLKFIEIDRSQDKEEFNFSYSSNYDEVIADEISLPLNEYDDFVKELFEHLKSLNFFNNGNIVIKSESKSDFHIGRPSAHFQELVEILFMAKKLIVELK